MLQAWSNQETLRPSLSWLSPFFDGPMARELVDGEFAAILSRRYGFFVTAR
jgi:hypothetical protein